MLKKGNFSYTGCLKIREFRIQSLVGKDPVKLEKYLEKKILSSWRRYKHFNFVQYIAAFISTVPKYLCGGSPDFFLFPYLDYWSDPLQRSEFGIREFWDTLYIRFLLIRNYIFFIFLQFYN
jgi:hypothetical protein